MIDIHAHFLHGVDDGPESIRETRSMIELYLDNGFTAVIETTHCYPGLFETPMDRVKEHLGHIGNSNIELYGTREYFVDLNFLEKLRETSITPYPDGKHILIEFSFIIPPINWEHLVFNIETAGYFPVLAHPERYEWLTSVPTFIREFKRRGGMLQGNMGSLLGHYGRYARRNFRKLMKEGAYDFLATDSHSHDQLKNITSNLPLIKKEIGEKTFMKLLNDNPQLLLESQK